MQRDMRYIETGMKRLEGKRCNLTLPELMNIIQLSDNMIGEAIVMAFYMGVEAGSRATIKELSHKCGK